MDVDTSPLVQAARDIAEVARELAGFSEANRKISPTVVEALRSAGLFRMLVPRDLGGAQASVPELIAAIEQVAAGYGSAGWCLMIGATTGLTAALLPRKGAEEIYGDPDSIAGGMLMPRGTGLPVDEGFRVVGRWSFGSGSSHATWMLGGVTVVNENGEPQQLPGGVPHIRLAFFPAGSYIIHDTWHVSGLRGTASNDYEVTGLWVPAHRTIGLGIDAPWAEGPLYAFPMYGLLAVGIAAVALGIARAAIDETVRLARVKTPTGSRRHLAERAAAQSGLAEAEALLQSSRSYVSATVGAAWAAAASGSPLSNSDRAALRLAATYATRSCSRAVDICYDLGGGSSIYESSPLQRHFRDIHTVTQHVMVGQPTYEVVGRIMLGLPVDTFML